MDSITLRKILESAVDAARLPQDLALILQRQRVDTHFVRSGDLRDIEALNLKDPDRKEWMITDALGPDLSWPMIAAKKNWQPIVATGLMKGSASAAPKMLRSANAIEIELDLLAEQIAMLVEALRLLIIRIINLVLKHVEKSFRTTLPRLEDTPKGVLRVQPQTDDYKPPSVDCVNQTSLHLRALREGIQAREPERFTLPLALQGMPEIHQALRDLKVQESKTPEQCHAEAQADIQAEYETARKFLAASKREHWEVLSLVNGYRKGKKRPDPAEGRKLMQAADAKVAAAERQLELAESKFPQQANHQGNDPQLAQFEHPQG